MGHILPALPVEPGRAHRSFPSDGSVQCPVERSEIGRILRLFRHPLVLSCNN